MNDLIYFLGVQIFSLPDIDNEAIIKTLNGKMQFVHRNKEGSHYLDYMVVDVGTPAQQEAQKLKTAYRKY